MSLLVISAALLGAFAIPAAAHAQHFTLDGSEVAIYDLVGAVNVVSGSGSSVTADVVFSGSDASKLRVEAGELRGKGTLRVIFPAEDIRSPDGHWGNTDVRVNSDGTFGGDDHWGGRRIRIGDDGLDVAATVTVHVPAGKKVWIFTAVGHSTVNGVTSDIVADLWSSTLEVTNLTGDLDVDAGSGNITLTGIKGDVNLDLGSGDMRVRNVTGSHFLVDGGSGSVSGGAMNVHELKLDVGSGSTRLDAVKADNIDIDSGSGEVDLALNADADELIVDSGSGSVTIHVPANFGARLTVDSGSGGFDSEIPITITHRHGSEIEGSVGDGKGELRIDSGSGAVRLLKS